MFSLHGSKDFLLILFSVCALSSSINSQPTYNYHFCLDQSNETSNTYYQSNLAVLLESLSSKASQNYSFYNESSNIGIYALFLCRGDVSNSTCQTCVSYAIRDITTQCPSNKSAIIWYDQCMLRYSDVNFFGRAQTSPLFLMYNTQNTTSPDQENLFARSQLGSLIAGANKTDMLFSTAEQKLTIDGGTSVTGYGLVQCTRDIDDGSCGECLSVLLDRGQKCCESKIGWRVSGPNCFLRYEAYSFTEPPPPPPQLQPPQSQPVPVAPQPLPDDNRGKKTSKTVIITISTVASIAVVAALFGFWFYKYSGGRKHEEERDTSQEIPLRSNFAMLRSIQLTDSGMHARDVDDSGERLYFDLSTILSATNNFSDENKLGEGGFGPVYKGLINGKETAIKRLSMKSKQDFGTARMFGRNQIEANTIRIVGTYGYMAPEYAMEGLFSIKSDVYSFGILMLEIVSGKRNSGFYHPERAQSLPSYVWRLWNEGKGVELIDQTIVDTCPISRLILSDQSTTIETGTGFVISDQSSTSASG
nr:cysteine-rich receptor-like protein kinase 25 [Quercus suber]